MASFGPAFHVEFSFQPVSLFEPLGVAISAKTIYYLVKFHRICELFSRFLTFSETIDVLFVKRDGICVRFVVGSWRLLEILDGRINDK